jgi:diguanylate cyclase (GGDEF)-like protein
MTLQRKILLIGGLAIVGLALVLFESTRMAGHWGVADGIAMTLGLAMGGTGAVLLGRDVLARVSTLRTRVRDAAGASDGVARVDFEGRDELASLAGDINGMIMALDRSRQESDEARVALEERVRQASDELAHAHERLGSEESERRRMEARLAHMSTHDPLTGLHNRARLEDELELQLAHAQRSGRGGAVLWLDLDRFKEINDSLGHVAGDDVLRTVAGRLQAQVRGDTLVSRLGGDEFAFLMPDVDADTALLIASRLLDAVRGEPYAVSGHSLRLCASAGVVLFPEHGCEAEDILSMADLAMYQAKEQGRDRVCLYDPAGEQHAQLRDGLSWAERIEDALRTDRFELWAQQLTSLTERPQARYELLIRMRDAEDTVIAPGAFLPTAERHGSIRQIDRWVVERAIELLQMEAAEGRDTWVDINMSGRSFDDPELLPLIERRLAETGVDPGKLGIEITETAAILDLRKARDFVDRLNALGCRFALDDFGSGFSSLTYLRELPIDCLKIDGSYIQNLCSNPTDQHMVKAMVELARGLGVTTVAEFVEDGETLGLLRSYGVDFGQGFYIHRPEPLAAVFN